MCGQERHAWASLVGCVCVAWGQDRHAWASLVGYVCCMGTFHSNTVEFVIDDHFVALGNASPCAGLVVSVAAVLFGVPVLGAEDIPVV